MQNSSNIIFILCLMFLNMGYNLFAQSQDSIVYPSYTLKDYTRIGITFGTDRTIVNNESVDFGVDISFYRTVTANIGLTANVWNNEKWNIRLGAKFRYFDLTDEFFVPRTMYENPPPSDFYYSITEIFFYDLKFNFTAEYYLKSTPKVDYFVGFGGELTHWYSGYLDTTNISEMANIRRTTEYIYKSSNDIYFGGNLELGVNLKSYRMLYRFLLNYHHNFSVPRENLIITNTNLETLESTTARKERTGNYVGFTLALHPSKNLFAKKPTSYKLAEQQKRQFSKEQSIYETYSKLGISYGMRWNEIRRNRTATNFNNSSISGSNLVSLGLNWHYKNREKYTQSFALEYLRLNSRYRFDLTTAETGTSNEYRINQSLAPLHGVGLSHYFDYIQPINSNLSWNAGFGVKLFTMQTDSQFFEYSFSDVEASLEYGRNFLFEGFISPSVGLDWNTNTALFRFKVFADITAWSVIRTSFITLAENQQGERSFTNESFKDVNFGASLSIYPKRGLFKKR